MLHSAGLDVCLSMAGKEGDFFFLNALMQTLPIQALTTRGGQTKITKLLKCATSQT